MIGKVTRVEVGLPSGHTDFARTGDKRSVMKPPPQLDYSFWIGPSRMVPYIESRVHMNWRWNYNTGGGQLLDWIGHHGDIAHWGLGFDARAVGDRRPRRLSPNGLWNTAIIPHRTEVSGRHHHDHRGGHPDIRSGTKWIWLHGWVWVDRGGFDAIQPGLARDEAIAGRATQGETLPVHEPLPEFPRRGEVEKADCCARRDGASYSAIPGTNLRTYFQCAGRPEDQSGDAKKEVIVGDETRASCSPGCKNRTPWNLG